MSRESEHSESEFYYPGELSHAEQLQSPTHSESKERNFTLLANEKARNFLRNQQANRRSRKQLFRINCPIINLSNKQTVGETSFLQRHQRLFIVGQKKENRRSTVPLKGKLPPSRETRLVSRETRLERNETSLERNETSLVSRECTGSTNISHSSVFEIRIKMSVSYRFDYRGRHYFHSR